MTAAKVARDGGTGVKGKKRNPRQVLSPDIIYTAKVHDKKVHNIRLPSAPSHLLKSTRAVSTGSTAAV